MHASRYAVMVGSCSRQHVSCRWFAAGMSGEKPPSENVLLRTQHVFARRFFTTKPFLNQEQSFPNPGCGSGSGAASLRSWRCEKMR